METLEIRLIPELVEYLNWVSEKTSTSMQESAEELLLDAIVKDNQYQYEQSQKFIDEINESFK